MLFNCILYRLLFLLLGVLFLSHLSACAGYGFADVISTSSTGKSIPDHVVSIGSGKNCSTARYQRGHRYCKEDEKKIKPTNLYCYRTIGEVTCYNRPNPFDSRVQKNDRDLHNQGKPIPAMPTIKLRPTSQSGIDYP